MEHSTTVAPPDRAVASTPRDRPPLAAWLWPLNLALAGTLSIVQGGAATGPTALVGMILLVLTLVPANLPNLARRPRAAALVRLRRPLGISAGIWFVAHSVVGFAEPLEGSSLLAEAATPDIALGVVATLVFVLLLATSNRRAQRSLGRDWKRLHRLVWFAVPLALAHSVLSGLRFAGHVESPGVVLLGGLVIFAAVVSGLSLWRGERRHPPHLALMGAGTATGALLVLALG